MFSLLSRRVRIPRSPALQPFSTTATRSSDVAKLILIGRLGKDPELRVTKSEKEYVSYAVFSSAKRPFHPFHLMQLHSSHLEFSTPSSGPRRQYAHPPKPYLRELTRLRVFFPPSSARVQDYMAPHSLLQPVLDELSS